MTESKWINRWNSWIAPKPTRPGVWRMKEGGYLVRGRALDPRTGRKREVRMTLPDADAVGAYQALQEELRRIRSGQRDLAAARTRFSAYAVSLLERKVAAGEIKSRKTREKWGYMLRLHLIPVFGDFFVDEIRRADVEAWKGTLAENIQRAKLHPSTANDRLAVLEAIMNSAVAEFELDRNPVAGLKDFDTSTHPTYTEEEPNSLTVEEVRLFLAEMRARFPQFFAMVALGFATGLRPSSLRPLRRSGPTPDLLTEQGVLLVRRSHTRRREVMETTKTKRHQRLTLPEELMDILRWHADRLPAGRMRDSELLFPSRVGSFHAPSVLDKPFAAVAEAIKLKKTVTPRAMRRTFQDLARAAEVKDLVTRAVSGHATETMQRHYSTVQPEEMRRSLARVIDLAGVKAAMSGNGGAGKGSGPKASDTAEAQGEATAAESATGGMHGGMHASESKTAGV